MKKNMKTKFPVKTLYVKDGEKVKIHDFPNFHRSGNITGMRKTYGIDAKLVRCGNYIYNVSSQPEIYEMAH